MTCISVIDRLPQRNGNLGQDQRDQLVVVELLPAKECLIGDGSLKNGTMALEEPIIGGGKLIATFRDRLEHQHLDNREKLKRRAVYCTFANVLSEKRTSTGTPASSI